MNKNRLGWHSPFPSQLWPNALWVRNDRGFWSWGVKWPPSVMRGGGHFYDATGHLEPSGGPRGHEAWPKHNLIVDPKRTIWMTPISKNQVFFDITPQTIIHVILFLIGKQYLDFRTWSPGLFSFNESVYCLFGVNYFLMLGSQIEACKPPLNHPKSD